jgi:nucleotide-binding universal stress UspA family protein
VATILHPTRGGASSYPNQDKAIELAHERNAKLIFLHVSNVQFLDTIASPVPVDLVEAELDHLSEFMLAMAQERAEKAGVTADTVVRHGAFDQALKAVIEEYGADMVILGSPGADTAVTTADYLRDLVHFLVSESSVTVLIVHDGEVVEEHRP